MGAWTIDIENVAGIRAGSAVIHPGVNAVRAENWRGKSSFIAAVETAMGTARPLTEGEDAGSVRIETDDAVYGVELARRNGLVAVDGEPYLDDEYDRVRADLFAFLDGANEVREAVRRGDDLASVLTRPLEYEHLEERISALQTDRDRVAAELERAREAANALPSTEERVAALEAERSALAERRDDLESADEAGGDGTARAELSDARAERERLRSQIDRLRDSLARAEETAAARREELDSIEAADHDDVSAELAAERDALGAVERDVELLETVYGAANRLNEAERFDLLGEVDHGVVVDTVTCLLCGQSVDRSEFATHLEAIGDRVADLRETAEAHRDRIDELEAVRAEAEDRRRRRSALRDEIADLEETVGERRESLDRATDRLDDLDDRLGTLTETVASHDTELTDVEGEIKYVEAELDEARAEADRLSDRADAVERLESERDDLTEEIEALRNRKDRLERRARDAFDAAMADLLDRFDTGFETARLTAGFELVVARDGREASLDALSEGELELIGLVAALAGHQAFDVGDAVPLLLLDDLGGLSDDSLHTVVDMLAERVDRVVLTVYPEHSSFDGHAIDPAAWSVVSDRQTSRTRP